MMVLKNFVNPINKIGEDLKHVKQCAFKIKTIIKKQILPQWENILLKQKT